MKAIVASVAITAGLVFGALTIGFNASGVVPTTRAQPALPGMCNGRADANTQITAHANGRAATKYILNIATDASATAEGILVLGQGKSRLEVTEWCRVWQHLPGQPRIHPLAQLLHVANSPTHTAPHGFASDLQRVREVRYLNRLAIDKCAQPHDRFA